MMMKTFHLAAITQTTSCSAPSVPNSSSDWQHFWSLSSYACEQITAGFARAGWQPRAAQLARADWSILTVFGKCCEVGCWNLRPSVGKRSHEAEFELDEIVASDQLLLDMAVASPS